MKTMKNLLAGFLIAGAIITTGAASLSPVSADEIVFDKYFIPEYHNLDFVDVAVTGQGVNTTFAVLASTGKVFTQGSGTAGQIGNGDSVAKNTPTEITASFLLTGTDRIVEIEGGLGSNFFAISQTGRVYSWGNNTGGANGQPTSTSFTNSPTEITSSFTSLAANERIVDVRLGVGVTIFRSNLNKFYSIGADNNGALGRITTLNFDVYTTPGILKSNSSTDFALNGDETFVEFGIRNKTGFIQTNKRLYTWGLGSSYQHLAGQPDKNFVTSVAAITTVLSVGETIRTASIGAGQGMLVTSQNRIYVWGVNSNLSLTKYANTFGPTQTLLEITDKFYDELDHYNDGYLYSILGSSEFISKISFFDNIAVAEISYDDEGDIFISEYLSWGKNGTALTGINSQLGLLGSGDSGNQIGLPRYVGSYDTVSNEGYSIQFVNSGSSTAIRTAEGGISFIGDNTNGQLGNGLTGTLTSTDVSYDINTYEYYYVMSFQYEARNLKVNYADLLTLPFTKESIDQGSNYQIVRDLIIYYYGIAETDYSQDVYAWYNLNDQGRALFGTELIDDLSAAFFDYDVLYYFEPYGLDVESLNDEGTYERYWTRNWAEAIAQYYVDFGYDYAPLTANAIAQLEDETKDVVARIQAILDNVTAFEDKLKAFRLTVDIYDEDEFNEDNFRDYETAILALFAEYEALTEIEKLYFDVYNDYVNDYDYLYGYYEDLRYYFIYFYVYEYEDKLFDVWDLEDEYGYSYLFENLDAIKALLLEINDLPDFAYDFFTEYDDYYEEYYYSAYEYWIYLNSLVPFIEEGEDVYFTFRDLIDGLVYEDEYPVLDEDLAFAILANYQAYLDLSEDAQYLLDGYYYEFLFEEAVWYLTNRVENALFVLYNSGTSYLLENLEDVNAALALYESLPENVLEFLSEEALAQYEYLKGLQAALTEALPVYNMIQELKDIDEVETNDIDAILDAIEAYNALSEDAKNLLDDEFLMGLLTQAAQLAIANLPPVGELTLEDEAKVEQARRAYNLLSPEQQAALGEDYLTRLQAAEARIIELKQFNWATFLTTMGVLLVHFAAGAYFVFLNRKELAKLTGIKALAK